MWRNAVSVMILHEKSGLGGTHCLLGLQQDSNSKLARVLFIKISSILPKDQGSGKNSDNPCCYHSWSVKWGISCHIDRQGCRSHQWFWPSRRDSLSPQGNREGGYQHNLEVIRLQPPCVMGTEELQMRKRDALPRSLRCIWKEWFQQTQTLHLPIHGKC